MGTFKNEDNNLFLKKKENRKISLVGNPFKSKDFLIQKRLNKSDSIFKSGREIDQQK